MDLALFVVVVAAGVGLLRVLYRRIPAVRHAIDWIHYRKT